jgi:hypothetical protein
MKRLVPTLALLTALMAPASAVASIPAEVTGTPPHGNDGATVVTVAPYLIDVSRVNAADQSFTADLFVLLSWEDPRLAGVFDATERVSLDRIWNPQLQILNRREVETTFPEQAEVTPDGTVTARQRYFGTFSAPLDLHDFPLDRQRFAIRMVVPGFGPDEVRLETAPAEVAGSGRSAEFSIPDWELSGLQTRPEPFGVAESGRVISGYLLSFEGRRHIGFWAGKAFTSVAIIIAMSWVVFWIDPKFVAPRLSVAVTSMLTLIAYRFLLGALLPRLSYLTRMDFFLIGATLLVLATVVQVAVTTRAEDRDQGRRARRINRHSRWLFPSMLLVLMAVAFLTA